MPELPDVTVYIEALARRIQGARLDKVRLFNPFLLRTAVPPIASAEGKRVTGLRRLGKRVVIGLEAELFLVLHLMIAGRLHWEGKKTRSTLALFEFDAGTLSLTEAGSKRRASLHLVEGEAALRAMDPGGRQKTGILQVKDQLLTGIGAKLREEPLVVDGHRERAS